MLLNTKKILVVFSSLSLIVLFSSCGVTQPVELKKEIPLSRTAETTKSLDDFGKMTEMFDVDELFVTSTEIKDETSKNLFTNAEIQQKITDILKSSVNAIGGKIYYVDNSHVTKGNMSNLGEMDISKSRKPQVMITGGITEFDQALKTTGVGNNIGLEAGQGNGYIGFSGSNDNKKSTSRISLDLNLIRLPDWVAVQKVQAINEIYVHSGLSEAGFGFTFLGVSIGRNESDKVIQGRHGAVRMLTEYSVLQLLGRYLELPYWKVTSLGSKDMVVIEKIQKRFLESNKEQQIKLLQQMLYLNGFDIKATGKLDSETISALNEYCKKNNIQDSEQISVKTYLSLYDTFSFYDARSASRSLKTQNSLVQKTLINTGSAAHKNEDSIGLVIRNLKQTYKNGDKIVCEVLPSKKGFLYVFYESSKDGIGLVFPNKYEKNNFLNAFQTKKIPNHPSVVLTAEDSSVVEKLYFIYSLNSLDHVIKKLNIQEVERNMDMNDLLSMIESSGVKADTYTVSKIDINKEK